MILVDTSVWIEFFRGREPVAAALEEHIEAGAVLVHALVFAELLQGCKSAAEADFVTQYWENLKDAESETGIITGGWYSFEHRLISRGVGLAYHVPSGFDARAALACATCHRRPGRHGPGRTKSLIYSVAPPAQRRVATRLPRADAPDNKSPDAPTQSARPPAPVAP